MKYFTIVLSFVVAALLAGCSSSRQDARTTDGTPPQHQEESRENQELSLKHFLEGSLLDQKGEYAKAILEYQDALRYQQDPAIYHAIARDYALIGKPDLAIQSGKEAVRLDPANRKYRETLADLYINAGDLENSITQQKELVRQDSTNENYFLTLARLYQIQKPDTALLLYRQATERFGPNMDAYLQMAQIYGAQGKLEKAIEMFKGMLDLEPNNSEVKRVLADTYLRTDSVDAALKIYNELLSIHPKNLELRASIAHAHLVKQDFEGAAKQFEEILSEDSISIDDQVRFGQLFVSFISRDSAVAPYGIKLFEKIKDSHPDDWRPYWFLGALYSSRNEDSLALENFQEVKELAKWNPDGWIGVASYYYDKNQFDSAISTLEEAKKSVPDEFRVHFLLGIAHQRKDQHREAASALERAAQINTKNVDVLTALALSYDELGRQEDSDSSYERALRIDPKNPLLLNNYGYSLAERNIQIERALEMAKEAVAQQPNNQSYLDTYGWVLYQLGRYEEAEQYIRKAVELGSTSAVIHEHLGDVYFRMNQREKALASWRKALELDSNNTGLREKIQRGSL